MVDTLTGRYVDPRAGRVTAGSYVRSWAEIQAWRPSTRSSRQVVVDTQIAPTFGTTPVASVRLSDVQAWIGRMTSGGLAASTVEAYYRVLAQMMASACRDKLIADSPCAGNKLPRDGRAGSPVQVLSVDEVEALASAVPRQYRALVAVSAGLGVRRDEACGLTVDRIDFLRRSVTIDR